MTFQRGLRNQSPFLSSIKTLRDDAQGVVKFSKKNYHSIMENERVKNKNMRKVQGNQRGVIIAALVALVIVAFFAFMIIKVQKENAIMEQSQKVLESSIAEEKARQKELESQVGKGLTEEDIIRIARDRFGLIFPNEIMFVPKEK